MYGSSPAFLEMFGGDCVKDSCKTGKIEEMSRNLFCTTAFLFVYGLIHKVER